MFDTDDFPSHNPWNRDASPPSAAGDGPIRRHARRLRDAYGHLDGLDLLRLMIEEEFPGRIALVSSFGAESAVLLDLVARIDRAIPVIFLDTGKLFPETLAYRDRLVARLGLTGVRSVSPDATALTGGDPDGALWRDSPDACCYLRKVQPLERALAGFDSWITGRKRFHGNHRSNLETIEAIGGKIKINPLARWSREEVRAAIAERNLPRHPLVAERYLSIGCQPCTHRVPLGAPFRSGRWAGSEKTECGIHNARWPREQTTPMA
ncbi:MAG: phosphoadenylyl-sulfate reductase [Alphaproteobacteria bacterium]